MTIKFEFKNKKELKRFLYESSRVFLQKDIIIRRGKIKKSHLKFTVALPLACGILIWLGIFVIFILSLIYPSIFKNLTERNLIFLIATSMLGIIWLKVINKSKEDQKKLLNKEIILTINKESIKIDCIGREISTNIENIIAIIIGEYSINIVTDNDIVFNIPNTKEDEVISTLKAYKNDIKVIKLK